MGLNSKSKTLKYRWYIFWVLAIQYLLVYFHRVSPAVVASDLIKDFHISGTSLGVLASAYFYSYGAMQIPVGILSDRWGAKKVIIIFGVIASCGSIIFGLSETFSLAVVSRISVGLGVSAIFIGTMKILANWFRAKEYARISGTLMSIGGAGWFIATTPLAFASQTYGWRVSFITIGIISFIMVIITWRVIADTPKKKGMPEIVEPLVTGSVQEYRGIRDIGFIFRQGHFWAIAIWFIFRGGALFGFFGLWAGPYLVDVYGLSQHATGNILSMIAFAMVFLSPVLGHLSDKTFSSRKKILVGTSIINVLCWLVMALYYDKLTLLGLYIIFFLMGITISSVGTIAIIATKEYFSPEIAGTSMGTMNIFPFVGGLIFQPLLGYILDRAGKAGGVYVSSGYQTVIWILFIASVIALFSILFSKETLKK
ncbi:MAG: MFS transporter [Syntrophorhabdaceae bacterium]|nr:MFS transporter [Syntrophorhabdaceae bacterium]